LLTLDFSFSLTTDYLTTHRRSVVSRSQTSLVKHQVSLSHVKMASDQHVLRVLASEPLAGDSFLHQAARENNVEKVTESVETICVDLLNNRWESPLIAAVQNGAFNSMTALLNRGARVDQQDRRGNTSLHYAVINSNVKVLKALLSAGADCNIRNAEGKSPFHLLVDSGHATMANYIVGNQNPIDLDIPDHEGNGPFMYALKQGCTRMIRYFLAIGYDPSVIREDGESPIHFAMKNTNPCILRAITKGFPIDVKNKDGHSPLAVAILSDNDVAVDILYRRAADATVLDNDGNTLLHLACKGKSHDIVMHVAQHQINVDARNNSLQTPLHIACAEGHPLALSALRSYSPDLSIQDINGRNALMIAIAASNPYKAMLLLEWQSFDLPLLLQQQDSDGRTVHNYCDLFFAPRVEDRIRELTIDSFPTRVIVFNYNHRTGKPSEDN
jgi:ankyrin repeat protein